MWTVPASLGLLNPGQAAGIGFSLPLVRLQQPQKSSSSTSDKQGESSMGGDGAGGGILLCDCFILSWLSSSLSLSVIGIILKPPCLGVRFLRGRLSLRLAWAATSLSDRFGLDFSHCCAPALPTHCLLAVSSGKRTKSFIGGDMVWSPVLAMGFLCDGVGLDLCLVDGSDDA